MVFRILVFWVFVAATASASSVRFYALYDTPQRIETTDLQIVPRGTIVTALGISRDRQWIWASVSIRGAEARNGWLWLRHLRRLQTTHRPSPTYSSEDHSSYEPIHEPAAHPSNSGSQSWIGNGGGYLQQSGNLLIGSGGHFLSPLGGDAYVSSSGTVYHNIGGTLIGTDGSSYFPTGN